MNMPRLFKKLNKLSLVKPVEQQQKQQQALDQFESIQADLEKHGVKIESEEALMSFLSDESADIADLLNQNRIRHAGATIVDVVEPLNSPPALLQTRLLEQE